MVDDTSVPGAQPRDPGVTSGDCVADAVAEKMLSLEVQRSGEVVMVAMCGEIDALTADRFSAALMTEVSAGPEILVVDLDGVQFFGSTGLTALALTQRAAQERGVDLRVVTNSRATLRPLQITGMIGTVAVYASRTDALAGCSSGEPGSVPPSRIG